MAAVDTFANSSSGINSAPTHAFAVTPDNSNDLAFVTRAIYVGGTGTLKVDMLGGETITFTALAAGVFHQIRATRIYATGTSATTIIGLY